MSKRTASAGSSPFTEGFKGKRSRIEAFGVTTFPPSDAFASMIQGRHSGLGNDPISETRVLETEMDEVDVTGFQTNEWVAYSKTIRATIVDLGTKNEENMIMITKKNSKEPRINPDRSLGWVRRYTMMNITTFNYHIASEQRIPEDPESVPEAIDILKDYYIEGVMINQWIQEGRSPDKSTVFPTTMERTANLIIQGRVPAKNIWGNRLGSSTKLFLIFKKIFSNGQYYLDAEAMHLQELPVGSILSSNKESLVTNKPYQLVPYANPLYEYPPDEELMFEDEYGIRRKGIAIAIGRVWYLENPNVNSKELVNCSWNYNVMVKAPIVQIFLDINY